MKYVRIATRGISLPFTLLSTPSNHPPLPNNQPSNMSLPFLLFMHVWKANIATYIAIYLYPKLLQYVLI